MPDTSKTKPQVAVITRTKDRPQLLERAIKSVLGQTFTDFTMVIVNDGGDPKTVEDLVARYKDKARGRIKILHNPRSLGMQTAANRGIQSIDSKYVIVHDDDDTWHREFLQKTTGHLEATGAMGLVASTDLVTEKVEGKKITTLETTRLFPDIQFINLYKMCFRNYAVPIGFLYKRSVFKTIGYYDETLRGFGDWDFGLRFLLHYDIDYLNLPQALAFYHQRPQADATNKNSVFTDDQQYLENLMFNRYLRNDIIAGKFGLGYIINSLRNQPPSDPAPIQSVLQHINEQTGHIARTITDNTSKLEHTIVQQNQPPPRSLPNRAVRRLGRKLARKHQ